jgi:hypothetical protein
MCYSFNSSVISYTIGMIASIAAFITKQYIVGTLILFYTQMQLSEMLIWLAIDTNNLNLNKIGTSFGKYFLATHNIAISIGILLSIYFLHKQTPNFNDYIPLLVSFLFFLFVVFYYFLPNNYNSTTSQIEPCINKDVSSCQNPNNRLKWPYPCRWYIISLIISTILVYLYVKPISSQILIFVIFLTSYFLSYIIFPISSAGSFWCFSTALLAPILVTINYFFIENFENEDVMT